METKSKDDTRFTVEERRALSTVPWIVGAAVSEVDKGGGVEASTEEMLALRSAVEAGLAAFSGDTMINLVEEPDRISFAAAQAEVSSKCQQALLLIKKKGTPEEVDAYKRLVMDVAYAVAKAAGSGYKGLGKKISPAESGMIDKIAVAMDATNLREKK